MAGNYDEEEQYTCSIHLDILVDPVALPYCGHWFCKGCIHQYVKSKIDSDPDCPECREPLDLPLEGVQSLRVNHKMREICRALEEKKEAPRCKTHRGELLNRFCCECLIPVCEECAEEEHGQHKCRSLGTAWRFVGPVIERKFQKAKEKLQASKQYHADSEKRKVAIIEQSDIACQSIVQLRDRLTSHIEESSEKLMARISDRADHDLALEEQFSLMTSSQDLPTLEQIERSENCLRRILSSRDNSYATKFDLEAVLDLHQLKDIMETELPKKPDPIGFCPSEITKKMLHEEIGDLLENGDTSHGRTFGSKNMDSGNRSRLGRDVQTFASESFSSRSTWSEIPMSSMKPMEQTICTTKRIILPDTLTHQPFDVQPYHSNDQLIVADVSGAITLLSGIHAGNIRTQILKRYSSDFFAGPSGVSLSGDNRIFVCNHNERHVEQVDMQRVACVREIGDDTCLTSPRAVTHSLTKRVLYVSDIRGGVKVFDSNTGRFLTQIGGTMLLSPMGLATNLQSQLFVADELQGQIFIFDTRMTTRERLNSIPTTYRGMKSHCYDVSLSTNGHVWVSQTCDINPSISLISEYDSDGRVLRTGGFELVKPRGIRVHSRQTIVADAKEHCIVMYE